MDNRFMVEGKRLDNGETVKGYLTKGWHFIYESQTHELVSSIEYEDKERCIMVSHYVDPTTIEPASVPIHLEAFDGYNCFVSYEPMENQIFRSDIPASTKLLIMGAETGNRKDKFFPDKTWINNWTWEAGHSDNAPMLFMKNSLAPITGEENMRRELPWGLSDD